MRKYSLVNIIAIYLNKCGFLEESLRRKISEEVPLEDHAAVIDDIRPARLDYWHQRAQSPDINLTQRDARQERRILRQIRQRRSNHVITAATANFMQILNAKGTKSQTWSNCLNWQESCCARRQSRSSGTEARWSRCWRTTTDHFQSFLLPCQMQASVNWNQIN